MHHTEVTQEADKRHSILTESVVGAGSGMILAHVAQSFPDGLIYKSIVITSAPIVSLTVKHFWNFFEPGVKVWLRNFNIHLARWKYERRINRMIANPGIPDHVRKELEEMKIHTGLEYVMNAYKHWRSLSSHHKPL